MAFVVHAFCKVVDETSQIGLEANRTECSHAGKPAGKTAHGAAGLQFEVGTL